MDNKNFKFKVYVSNVPDAVVKLNGKETTVIDAKEGETVKWVVTKDGYLSDMGEVKLSSSISVTIRLARYDAKVKSTYTKIYKEDGHYVSEQIELSNPGACLPSAEGQVGKVLSVTEGNFVSWVDPSGTEPADLPERVERNTLAIQDLKEADEELDGKISDLQSDLHTKADATDVQELAETKADKSEMNLKATKAELESFVETINNDYWTAQEVSTHIESSSEATLARVEAEIGGKADKATTLFGYGISDAYTKEEVDSKVSSFMNYKGQVNTTGDLPNENVAIGDVYNVKSTGANYCWNGSDWDKLSEDIDLSYLATKEALQEETLRAKEAEATKANATDMEEALALKADKSEIPEIPANVSAFNNDAGYLTEHQSLDALATKDALQAEAERAQAAEALKANSSDMELALAAKLTKSELIKADGSLSNKVTTGNNYALLFNENDGGGAQFKNVDANVISYVGVNDEGPTGVCAQIYSKYIADNADAEQTKNVGTRLNINPTGMFYTNGRTTGAFDPADELATKGTVEAAKGELNEALDLKADKSELPEVPTQISAFENDAGYLTEHQSLDALATKEELQAEVERAQAAEDLKADKSALLKNGYLYNKNTNNSGNTSLIFNENDGGGAQFTNNQANVISYVGVNEDNDEGVCVQIYSKYINDNAEKEQVKNKGSRLNVNPNGMFYTKGKTNGAFEASEELVTKHDVSVERERAELAEGALSEALEQKADKSEIPEIPVNVSAFENDAGYLTEHQSLEGLATKEELNTGLDSKLTKSELIRADGSLYNEITNEFGNQALLWNEDDGGGSIFRNNQKNVVSFVGVNQDEPTGVCAQIYSKFIRNDAEKEQVQNKGSRLNINPNGMFYTKGKVSGSFDADDELMTLGGMNAALESKADKSEIPSIPTEVSAFNNDAGYLTEHQSLEAYATKEEMNEGLGTKIARSELLKNDGSLSNKVFDNNNYALLFNEKDGGGSQYRNVDANVISYVGVNNEDENGVCVQIYSKYIANKAETNQVQNKGTRLNVNPKGMYYTKGKTSGAFEASEELATVGDVAGAEGRLNEILGEKADKSELPEVPTQVSAFENDAGYLTEHQSLEALATKEELSEGLNAKISKSDLLKNGALNNKVTAGNNYSLIFNENDGGGSQFKNVDANIISYVGSNDGDENGVCVQIYSKYIYDNAEKGQVQGKGTRLNVNPKGMFYTKNRTNGNFDASEELATKGTVDAAKSELNEALDLKADKSELPEIPENVSAFNNDAGYLTEHQSLEALATKEELNAGLETKLTKSDLINAKGFLNNTVTLANGNQTQLWNEASGGGSLFQNNVDNVKSFIGVNDEDPSGVCAQIYSKYINNNAEAEQVANKGSRLNINPTGMYYTSGKTTGGDFGPADELATKGDVSAEAGRADAALDTKASLADFESLAGQLRVLNDRLSEMAKSNKEDVVPTGEAMTISDATKDFTLVGDLDNKLRVTESKSFAADGVAISANMAEAIVVKASEEATFKNCEVTCDMPHGSGTNVIKVHDSKYITIRDMTFTGYTYNTIMTGQAQGSAGILQPIKSLVIENCEFKEFADHVNIWAASFEDNAVVTINNCHFYNCDEQVFAFSNATLAKNITINITNCVIDKYEKGDEYEGFIFCQDYNTPKTAEGFAERNMFKEMTINISNVTVCGEKLTKENFKMGTGAAGQMLYVYGDKLYMYDPDIYPTVNVM